MKCRDARRSLVAYLDRDLSASKVEELEGHLAECGVCASELESLRRTLNLVAEESPPEVPEALRANLLARVRMKLEERRGVRGQLLPRFAYVSAVVLVVTVGLLLFRLGRGPEEGIAPLVQNGSEWMNRVKEMITTVDVEAVELSLSEYESPAFVLSLPEYSQGVSKLLATGLPVTDIEGVKESLEEESDLSISTWMEDLSESEREELAAKIKARWLSDE